MRLPNAENAIIPAEKLRDYLLRAEHPYNRGKAAVFAALGYTEANWRQLEADIRAQHLILDAELGKPSDFGAKYEVRGLLRGPLGVRVIITVWMIDVDSEVPRLLTAHPG